MSGEYAIYVNCCDNRLEPHHGKVIKKVGYKGRTFPILVPGGAASSNRTHLYGNIRRMMKIAKRKGVVVKKVILGVHPDCGDCKLDETRKSRASKRAAEIARDFDVETVCVEVGLDGNHRTI